MHEAELRVGHCTVYAAALDASPASGFLAAVLVTCQAGGGQEPTEVFRDERLEDGKVWVSPAVALAHALEVGEAAVCTHEAFGRCQLCVDA